MGKITQITLKLWPLAVGLFALALVTMVLQRPTIAPSTPVGPLSEYREPTEAERLLGLDPSPFFTSALVVFSGTAKLPEVQEVVVSFETGFEYRAAVDQETGRWEARIDRRLFGAGEQNVIFRILGTNLQREFAARFLFPPLSEDDESLGEQIPVDWRATPVVVSASNIVPGGESVLNKLPSFTATTFYKVGTVTSGQYVGNDVLYGFLPCYSMGCGSNLIRLLWEEKTRFLRVLADDEMSQADFFDPIRMEGSVPPGPVGNFEDLFGVTLSGLALPDTVTVDHGQYIFFATKSGGRIFTSDDPFIINTDVEPIGKTDDGVPIYAEKNRGCIYLLRPDGTLRMYSLWADGVRIMPEPDDFTQIFPVDWTGGVRNTQPYALGDIGGCGGMNCFAVRDREEVKPSRLKKTGETRWGTPVFEPIRTDDEELKLMYELYQPWQADRMSFEQFVGSHPFVYWQDPFDRWIRLTRQDFLPAVECGKPVIYLYPQKNQTVHVAVGLRGTMTVSEPPHGPTGWTVVAHPDGTVTNIADGKNYPNLFWEGTGVYYKTPKEGFVVKSEEVGAWFEQTLAKIGFTDRESAEFREFWIPKFQGHSYYFITFVDQSYFDTDAPLSIQPKPDAVTRIFMEYQGLDGFKSVASLTLPKIKRQGFSVVEWGGALRK